MAIGKITELRDADNKAIYPITSTKAVYMEDGESKLSDELTKISEDMIETTNNLDMAKIGVSGVKYDSLKSRLDNEYLELYNMYNEDKFVPQTGQGLYLNDTRRGMTRNTVIKGKTVKNLADPLKKRPYTFTNIPWGQSIILSEMYKIKTDTMYTLYYTLHVTEKVISGGSTDYIKGQIYGCNQRNGSVQDWNLGYAELRLDIDNGKNDIILADYKQRDSFYLVRHTFSIIDKKDAKYLSFRPIQTAKYVEGTDDHVSYQVYGVGLYEGDVSINNTVIPINSFSYPGQSSKLRINTTGRNLFNKYQLEAEFISDRVNNICTVTDNGVKILKPQYSNNLTYGLKHSILEPGNYKIYCEFDTTKAAFQQDTVGAYIDVFYTDNTTTVNNPNNGTIRTWMTCTGMATTTKTGIVNCEIDLRRRTAIVLQLTIREGVSGTIIFKNFHIVKDTSSTNIIESSDYSNELTLPINGLKSLPSGLCDQIYYDGKNLVLEQNVKEMTNLELIENARNLWTIEDKESNWKFGCSLHDCRNYHNTPNQWEMYDTDILPVIARNTENVNPGSQLWFHENGPEVRFAIPKIEIPIIEGQSLPSQEQVNEWIRNHPFKILYPLKTANKFILPYGQLSFETKEGYTAIFANDNVNPVTETEVPMNTANSVATLNNTTEKMSRDIYNLTNGTNNKFKEIQEKELSSIDAIITSDIRIGKLEESMDGSTFSRYEFMRLLISNKYNDSKRKERLDFYLSKNILNPNQYKELINL